MLLILQLTSHVEDSQRLWKGPLEQLQRFCYYQDGVSIDQLALGEHFDN